MKTNKIIMAIAASFLFLNSFAQEVKPVKIKEIGLGLYNFQNFSLQYRWGNDKRLFRLNGNLGVNNGNGRSYTYGWRNEDTTSNSYNYGEDIKTPINLTVGLGFSSLKLKSVHDKFGIVYGPLIGISYSYLKTERYSSSSGSGYYTSTTTVQKSQTIQPYLGIVVGASYKINDSFFIYLEIGPNVYYNFNQGYTTKSTQGEAYNSEDETSSKSNSFGISSLSNSGAMLTFVYRYNK
jgi:hypothetical protein